MGNKTWGRAGCVYCAPGFDYAAIQWGIWCAGGIAIPLPISYPQPELEYIITDSSAKMIISNPSMADKVSQIEKQRGNRLVDYSHAGSHGADQLLQSNSIQHPPDVGFERSAMILYTC